MFFEGSPEKLVAVVLDPNDMQLGQKEIGKIRRVLTLL